MRSIKSSDDLFISRLRKFRVGKMHGLLTLFIMIAVEITTSEPVESNDVQDPSDRVHLSERVPALAQNRQTPSGGIDDELVPALWMSDFNKQEEFLTSLNEGGILLPVPRHSDKDSVERSTTTGNVPAEVNSRNTREAAVPIPERNNLGQNSPILGPTPKRFSTESEKPGSGRGSNAKANSETAAANNPVVSPTEQAGNLSVPEISFPFANENSIVQDRKTKVGSAGLGDLLSPPGKRSLPEAIGVGREPRADSSLPNTGASVQGDSGGDPLNVRTETSSVASQGGENRDREEIRSKSGFDVFHKPSDKQDTSDLSNGIDGFGRFPRGMDFSESVSSANEALSDVTQIESTIPPRDILDPPREMVTQTFPPNTGISSSQLAHDALDLAPGQLELAEGERLGQAKPDSRLTVQQISEGAWSIDAFGNILDRSGEPMLQGQAQLSDSFEIAGFNRESESLNPTENPSELEPKNEFDLGDVVAAGTKRDDAAEEDSNTAMIESPARSLPNADTNFAPANVKQSEALSDSIETESGYALTSETRSRSSVEENQDDQNAILSNPMVSAPRPSPSGHRFFQDGVTDSSSADLVTAASTDQLEIASQTHSLFNGVLLLSIFSNVYLMFWLNRLRQQFRAMVTSRRAVQRQGSPETETFPLR